MDAASMQQIEQAFHKVYATRYGAATSRAVEIVSYRLAAWGLSDKPRLPSIGDTGRSLGAAMVGTRAVVFNGAERQVTVFDRDRLPSGRALEGPVVIEESGSTTVVPPDWTAVLDTVGCLVMRRS
jgi:N-methylhydantoinase A